MQNISTMFDMAVQARSHAYAPYSHFQVGCCIQTPSGRLFSGANVENAAYPSGHCAETSAIGAMITQGETKIDSVLIVASGDRLCMPCGFCLQKISEFATDETNVHICGPEGHRKSFKFAKLLPLRFSLAINNPFS